MNKKIKIAFNIVMYALALWGLALTIVFFAMKFGLTKSSSKVDAQSEYFKSLQESSFLNNFANQNDLSKIDKEKNKEKSDLANQNFSEVTKLDEWKSIKAGIIKDLPVIKRVSLETGISERLLVTPLVVEQLRLMTSQREIFKKYFQPLSVLGSQTQFSLGIYGIKENTAKEIESHLKDKNSLYYLGSKYENMLDYQNSSSSILLDSGTGEVIIRNTNIPTSTIKITGTEAERIKRLTSEKDHYYSYLYAALYMKQILNQWKNSFDPVTGKSFDISHRPEILMTVYNLGFEKSIPKANPEVGGAIINLNGKDYTFGSLAFYFYYSDEMRDVLK